MSLIVPNKPQGQVKTEHGRTYEPAQWNGVNESGFTPIGDLVLVMIDKHVEKIGSIKLAEEYADRAGHATQSGVVVAIGEGAFAYSADRMREFTGAKPKVGDRIIFNRYAGNVYVGDDGISYRIMTDKEIAALHTLKEGK